MAASARHGCSGAKILPAAFLALLLSGARIQPASAQNLSSGSIDGVVTDDSGGALPGVAVTASSPALQVKQVSTVTDIEGRYRLLDLPRGIYQIDFDLAGFQ